MNIDTSRIPQDSLADLMRSLGAALVSFRRQQYFAGKDNDTTKNKNERTQK